MTEKAHQTFEKALKEQHSRNVARRIRTRVDQARQNPHPAAIRWPFELFQNALDAGPRDGRATVTIRLRREPAKVVFEHDGAPFTSEELAALLSGGSSKEFESEITTGRFGTGFLVTHVLAEKTRLRGLLQVDTGSELFDLTLDRGGDEDAILDNIKHSHAAIRAAEPVPDPTDVKSAVLEYASSDDDVWGLGLKELRSALPYLYGTRRRLGRVEVWTTKDHLQVWEPSETHQTAIEGGFVESRVIVVTGKDFPKRELLVYRFAEVEDASAAALVVVEKKPHGFRVCLPENDAPRVFREYPLRASGFVPVNFILDGKFDPEQERSSPLMSANDKVLLEQALSAAVVAVKHAIDQKWEKAHWLARAEPPSTGFDATNRTEKEWWTEQLAAFAQRLAVIPIVDCGSEYLSAAANEDELFADFIIPRLLEAPGRDETSVERLWPLVHATDRLLPPRRELAADWTVIAKNWGSLGVMMEPISVAKLAKWARADAETLDQLNVNRDAQEWLADFIDIVGECLTKRGGIDLSALDGIVPNQNQTLCSPGVLKRDSGVSERLKDICKDMGNDVRKRLLLSGFEEIARSSGLTHVTKVLEDAILRTTTEDEITEEAAKYMSENLPENERCDDDTLNIQQATVRLFAHLWESRGEDAASIARTVPLVASNGRSVRWSSGRLFMAPICAWPKLAQPFADAYPPNRVLNDLYAGSETDEIPNVTKALAEWEIALTDPVTDTTVDLRKRRLDALSSADTNGIVVPEQRLSQIALLQPEVLNRCQEGEKEASALLGLVLCYVARRDQAWKEQRTVKGRRLKEEVEVPIRGALWLADLKVRAWVPVPGEDDKPQKMVATATTLKDLLNPAWVQENDDAIKLLSECFGFDQLELRLVGIAQDSQERRELRNSLAKLVETGGANPQVYADLAAEVEARRQQRRDVKACRDLGLAVQGAIGSALRNHNLKVELVDRGFDYEVRSLNDDVIHDAGSVFEIGPYLVEVKATTTGQARLTAMQAATAAQTPERYVLCVVDLRQALNPDLEQDWTAERVEPLAKLVSNIGKRVKQPYNWVEAARTSAVRIRNESALRYEVPPRIWESGMSISTWVKKIKTTLS